MNKEMQQAFEGRCLAREIKRLAEAAEMAYALQAKLCRLHSNVATGFSAATERLCAELIGNIHNISGDPFAGVKVGMS